VEQASGLRHDCFAALVYTTDPIGVGFVDLVAGWVKNREQRISVAERDLPLVQGDQFIDVCTDPQLDTPLAGNSIDQQKERGDLLDWASTHRYSVGQSQIGVMTHHASPVDRLIIVNNKLTINS
jgi:hypothetical protein